MRRGESVQIAFIVSLLLLILALAWSVRAQDLHRSGCRSTVIEQRMSGKRYGVSSSSTEKSRFASDVDRFAYADYTVRV